MSIIIEERMDLRQEKLDEMRRDMLEESHLRSDYDTFRDNQPIKDLHEEAFEALRKLRNVYKMYDHEFDINEFKDEL
jgi:hypothetical protein